MTTQEQPAMTPLAEVEAANLDHTAINVFVGALALHVAAGSIDRKAWTASIDTALQGQNRRRGLA